MSRLHIYKVMLELSKKEIVKRRNNIEGLGMSCDATNEALKKNLPIKELREAFETDRRIIKGAINDISLWV